MEALVKCFEYEGNRVTFRNENGDVMVNATEMAKPFGKNPYEFLRLEKTVEYLNALESTTGKSRSDLIITQNGGSNPGTWFCQKLTIRFGQWLSPVFSVWVDTKIEDILTKGVTYRDTHVNDDEIILKSLNILQGPLSIASRTIEEQSKVIKEQEPVVEYAMECLISTSTYNTEQIAKELHLKSAQQLNNILHSMKIQHKSKKQWVLNAPYCTMGYTDVETYPFFNQKTQKHETSSRTVWNEKGRRFIHELLNGKLKKHG